MPRARDDLAERLMEQFHFLRVSVAAYDKGYEAEGVRLAATMRVLFRDYGSSSVSLLGQLGIKDRIRLFDTTFLPFRLMGEDVSNWAVEGAFEQASLVANGPGQYVPYCYSTSTTEAPRCGFDEWWTMTIAADGRDLSWSREDLVLTLTHKEGGAHIDPHGAGAEFDSLHRGNFPGWETVTGLHPGDPGFDDAGVPLRGSAALVSMRQIADEVGQTLGPITRSIAEGNFDPDDWPGLA